MSYIPPTSWNDKGMDWENPDPTRLDYAMALILAIKERYYAISSNGYSNSSFEMYPYLQIPDDIVRANELYEFCNIGRWYRSYNILSDRIITHDFIEWIKSSIFGLCYCRFIDIENTEKEIENKKIIYISIRSLMLSEETNFLLIPSRGSPICSVANYFKIAKRCLDKMTVRHSYVRCETSHSGRGSSENFSESITSAIEDTKDSFSSVQNPDINFHETSVIYGYCKTYKYYTDRYHTEIKYYSDCVLNTIKLNSKSFETYHLSCRALVYAYAIRLSDYSAIGYLTTNFGYDDAGTGFQMNEAKIIDCGIFPSDRSIYLGCDENHLPRNTEVPNLGDTTGCGFAAYLIFMLDFAVEGGFRFRP